MDRIFSSRTIEFLLKLLELTEGFLLCLSDMTDLGEKFGLVLVLAGGQLMRCIVGTSPSNLILSSTITQQEKTLIAFRE